MHFRGGGFCRYHAKDIIIFIVSLSLFCDFFFTVNSENFNHAKHPEPSIGDSNEGPTAPLDPEDGQVQCVHMGLLQVSSNEVRIASDESKILG